MRNVEYYENPVFPYIFRKSVPAGEKGVLEIELTSHGYVTEVDIIFAAGENGTLQLRPYVIHPGELVNELLKYAGNNYISGDDCEYKLPCFQEVENHSMLRLAYENTGVAGTADSQIMVNIIVRYDSYVEPRNVIG
jgi:hypothetical protein